MNHHKPWSKVSKGKWAEAHVKDWLEARALYRGFAYHRYPDTRSARAVIAAQPSDYEFTLDGVGYKLEVKETGEKYRLPRANIGQWAVLRRFRMAGVRVLILVYRTTEAVWLTIPEEMLFPDEGVPTSLPFAGLPTFLTAGDALAFAMKEST